MPWIPRKSLEIYELMRVWRVKLADVTLRNKFHWDAAECDEVVAKITGALGAHDTYEADKSPENRLAKDRLLDDAVKAMREFARDNIRNNKYMTPEERLPLGISPHDDEPSPVETPHSGPDSKAHTDAGAPGVVEVRYAGPKPYGVFRVEIGWAISDTPLDSPDQLDNHETFPHNPWEHTFGAGDRGKKMYYSLRYLTSSGESHWSDVKEVIIP